MRDRPGKLRHTPLDYETLPPLQPTSELRVFPRRTPAAVTVVTLLASYFIFIVAGHGVAPIGLFLIWAWEGWTTPMACVGLGFAIQLLSLLIPLGPRTLLYTCGIAAMTLGVTQMILASESTALTMITGIPYFTLLIVQLVHLGLLMHATTRMG
jgi:hypothetical protein